MNILRDWMQEAEPPAVNDLVTAVESFNKTMHQQLVNYLRSLSQSDSVMANLGELGEPSCKKRAVDIALTRTNLPPEPGHFSPESDNLLSFEPYTMQRGLISARSGM